MLVEQSIDAFSPNLWVACGAKATEHDNIVSIKVEGHSTRKSQDERPSRVSLSRKSSPEVD
jgi:hypothetical protein